MNKILPWILAFITQQPRYLPKIEWSDRCWTHNLFRLYELIFWRRYGIRHEFTAGGYWKDGRQITFYKTFTLEAKLAKVEGIIRNFLSVFSEQYQVAPQRGAIAFDVADGSTTSSSNVVTIAVTFSGSNRLAFPGGKAYSASTITATAVDGVAGTLVDSQDSTSDLGGFAYLYFKAAPTAGAVNVTVTGSNDNHTGLVSSYTGCAQVTPEAKAKGVTDSNTTATQAVTSVSDNAWAVCVWANQTGAVTASTGATMRKDLGAFANAITDSGSATTPAGSISQTCTIASGGNWAHVAAAFAPVAVTGNKNLLLLGVGT